MGIFYLIKLVKAKIQFWKQMDIRNYFGSSKKKTASSTDPKPAVSSTAPSQS